MSNEFIIQLSENDTFADIFCSNGLDAEQSPNYQALIDCTLTGDCQTSCEYVLNQLGIDFKIVAKNKQGKYENRYATKNEIIKICREIYFESETDFSKENLAKLYLVWEACSNLQQREAS